jgi:hypothetical protein
MFSVQPRLPFILPQRARMRRTRRPFTPSQEGRGPYRLPHDVRDRLASALAPFRNRDAAWELAVFLARYWSMPGRIVGSFAIDRRALSEHPELGLTEKRVRSAIRTLEEVGFLDRDIPPSGSKYKATEDGLHRKPIQFVFGAEYASAFLAANKRAAAARGRLSRDRRAISPSSTPRPSTVNSEASFLKGPKSRNPSERLVNMGPLVKECGLPPKAFVPDPKLEAALDRLKEAIGKAGESGGKGSAK